MGTNQLEMTHCIVSACGHIRLIISMYLVIIISNLIVDDKEGNYQETEAHTTVVDRTFYFTLCDVPYLHVFSYYFLCSSLFSHHHIWL